MDRNNIKKRLIFWYTILWLFIMIALWQGYFVYFPDTTTTRSKWIGLFAGAVAILGASCKINEILLFKHKNEEIDSLVKKIKGLSNSFSRTKHKVLMLPFIILCIIFYKLLSVKFMICFICGAISNILSVKVSDFICPNGAIRILKSSNNSLNCNYKLSFNTGSVTALFNIGISICLLVILFHMYKDYQILNGFILGYGIICIIDCASWIITKKAVINADTTVNSLEYNLNSNVNPLTGLKYLSKNLANITILNSDFGLTFVSVIIASMTVGAETLNLQGVFFPIIIAANGVFATIISILIVRFNKIKAQKKLYIIELCSILLLCFLSSYCIKVWFPTFRLLICPITIGAVCGLLVNFLNVNCTNIKYKTIKDVSNSAIRGVSSLLSQSFKESFGSTFLPTLVIMILIILSFLLTDGMNTPLLGVWGITLGILAMYSVIGVLIAINIFSYIINGISEANIEQYNDNKDDYITTSTNIIGMNKNFIIISSILCTLSLVIAYSIIVPLEEIDMLNPFVMGSLVLGASLPFLFNSFILSGISKTSKNLVFEVKKQFRQNPQILREEMEPNNYKCINISAKNSAIQAVFYIIIVSIIFFTVAFNLKTEAIAGLILGALLSIICVLLSLNNSCFAVKTAKKYLEDKYANSENSYEYSSLSVGEDVLSELRNTIVPTCNIFIKFIAIMALTLAPLFL